MLIKRYFCTKTFLHEESFYLFCTKIRNNKKQQKENINKNRKKRVDLNKIIIEKRRIKFYQPSWRVKGNSASKTKKN